MNRINPHRNLPITVRRAMDDELNVIEVRASALREYLEAGFELPEELDTAIDEAQGEVHSGAENAVYVVIKVIR